MKSQLQSAIVIDRLCAENNYAQPLKMEGKEIVAASTASVDKRTRFLQKDSTVFFGAMICCALWGSAFPCVKLGMKFLNITAQQTADQILFAGERFFLAGFLVVVLGSIARKKVLIPHGVQHAKIWKLCIFQTILQYSFYYVGIAHTSGVNTSIVDSLAYFLSILTACVIFRMEKLTGRKILGCLLGFAGVVIVNLSGHGLSLNMTFIGEGMIFLSAVAYSFSSVFAKRYSQGDDPVLLSGYQFMAGALVLMAMGLLGGGHFRAFTPVSFALYVYLAFISTAAYTLWTILLKYNDVSKVSIYGFMNPVFGVILSALILGEHEGFGVKYLVALVCISIGIALVNRKTASPE